jgi:predicted membrane protein
MSSETTQTEVQPQSTWHWPLLIWGMVIMIVVNAWPNILVNPETGKTSHGMVMWLLLSMSASFVRGVGFIPRHIVPRYLLGSWAALCYGIAAAVLYYLHI